MAEYNYSLGQNSCKRCGTCCKKGGPTFHGTDRELVGTTIPLSSIVTYRKGELAYHPTLGRLIELPKDMIKIKGKGAGPSCLYFDEDEKGCTIYETRPLECRTLECWRPEPLMDLFLRDLLQRKDIIDRSLWKIMDEYDSMFSPTTLIKHFQAGDRMGIERMVTDDVRFRKGLVEKYIISPDDMDAVLGRPICKLAEALSSIF